MGTRPKNSQANFVIRKFKKEIFTYPLIFIRLVLKGGVKELIQLAIEYGREFEEQTGIRNY